MIKLIVGNKGSGKTKTLIGLINEAAKTSQGNIVCIEKGLKLTYDIDLSVRLIDIEDYSIKGFNEFYGFLSGLFAGNYDITDVFVDATLKIGGRDLSEFEKMIERLKELLEDNKAKVTFTVSCDESEIPQSLKQYII